MSQGNVGVSSVHQDQADVTAALARILSRARAADPRSERLFCKEIGVNRRTFRSILAGVQPIDVPTLVSVCWGLRLEPEQVLKDALLAAPCN